MLICIALVKKIVIRQLRKRLIGQLLSASLTQQEGGLSLGLRMSMAVQTLIVITIGTVVTIGTIGITVPVAKPFRQL